MRALLLGLWLTVLLPLDALAHAQLHGADPAAGVILDHAPGQVILTFNEPVAALRARWFGPDGRAQEVESHASGVDLIVTVPPDVARGTQALSWRVVSDDGHPVSGTHVFSIGVASGVPGTAPDAAPRFAAVARALLTLALVTGVGGMVWATLSRSPAPGVIRSALWAVPPAGLALMAAQAMDLSGSGTAALADPSAWRLALASPFATATGLALLAALLAASGRRAPVTAAWVLAALSFAAAGHAARAQPVALMAPLVLGHAVAVIFWAGALPGLIAALRRPDAAPVMARFSRLAVPMVAVLALTGAVLAWRQVGDPAALTGTAYGRVLSAKLVLVALVLGLAARHRFILTPALARNAGAARPAFVRSLRLELALMVAILALTAAFRLTPPPRALADLPQTRAEVHLHGAAAMADLVLIPGRPGANRIEITPLDGDFRPLDPLAITLFFSRPAEGLEPVELRAERGEGGIWRAGPVHLPPGGALDVVADILITDFRKALIGGDLTLLP